MLELDDAVLNESGSGASADIQQCARNEDESLCFEVPRPLFAPLDLREVMRPQGPTTGINAVIGAWPGNETDEEIFRMLEEMS
jgi:hypothetical protein